MNKYKLKKDLPFAEAGAEIMIGHENISYVTNDKEKTKQKHEKNYVYMAHKSYLNPLIADGWIEKVGPREWYEVEVNIDGEWTSAGCRYDDKQLAREATCRLSCNARFIKVREVENE